MDSTCNVLICCQSVSGMVHREISPDGTYYAYFPFGDMRDVQLMLPFHNKGAKILSLTKTPIYTPHYEFASPQEVGTH